MPSLRQVTKRTWWAWEVPYFISPYFHSDLIFIRTLFTLGPYFHSDLIFTRTLFSFDPSFHSVLIFTSTFFTRTIVSLEPGKHEKPLISSALILTQILFSFKPYFHSDLIFTRTFFHSGHRPWQLKWSLQGKKGKNVSSKFDDFLEAV